MNKTAHDLQLLSDFFRSVGSIDEDFFQEIAAQFEKRVYKKGVPILKAGQIETKSNLVVKGVVHQYIYDEELPITVNITPKGLVFNSLKSYIEGTPSVEIQEAITDVEILSIEKIALEQLVTSRPSFGYLLYRIHEQILLDRENRTLLLQYRSPSKRYALFHELVNRSSSILGNTPEKYIASYLNMTPQQYSREKKNYEAKA